VRECAAETPPRASVVDVETADEAELAVVVIDVVEVDRVVDDEVDEVDVVLMAGVTVTLSFGPPQPTGPRAALSASPLYVATHA
jgi:hypothetical protein